MGKSISRELDEMKREARDDRVAAIRQSTMVVPPVETRPATRDPVQVTAAYLLAYLGTLPREKKGELMKVAKAFAPYLGTPETEEPAQMMCARVQRCVEEMEWTLKRLAELRTIAESYQPLTVEDVIS